jgi:hypothetical protein
MLWIDGVGGYLVCWGERVVLGQPVSGAGSSGPEIGIWGDLSRQHAAIHRVGEGYTLEPLRTTRVEGRSITETTLLADGQTIQLGESVRLNFRQPHPWSRSARLELASHHRPQPAADGVLLAAEVLILGAGPHCHVVCPGWQQEVLLVRQRRLDVKPSSSDFQSENHGLEVRATGDVWSIRSTGELMQDGRRLANPAQIAWNTSLQAGEARLTLEAL